MSRMMTVRIDSLHYPGGSDPVLRGLHFDVNPGEFIHVTGASESGKSVLCRILAGIIPSFEPAAIEGEVLFCGRNLAGWRLPELAGEIGFVGDDPLNQLFCATLKEDLAFGPCSLLLERPQIVESVKRAFRFVGLNGCENRMSETLSGGEIQRAAIASALTLSPKLLILDRAFDQIDHSTRRDLWCKLDRMCSEQGKAVILVDSRSDECSAFVHRTIVMERGTLTHDTNRRRASASVAGKALLSVASGAGSHARDGRAQSCRSRNKKINADPIITVKDLWFRYQDSDFALQGISLELLRGEFVAIVGENGAGKTTLAKHFNGLLRPSTGEVIVNGLAVKDCTPARMSDHVGYLFQDPLMQVCSNTVREEVGFGLTVRKTPSLIVNERVESMLKRFDLLDVADEHPYRLSRSKLQRVALASCMVNEAEILVVDEPTSALDYPRNREIMALLTRENSEGRTIIMITHDQVAAEHFCGRIIVMKQGRVESDSSRGRKLEAVARA
ncbi:MAG: ATP-binding cassette domain-containing protein [Desulfomonile tiedjei]|uniref:ATP-binding cassette domain-containing protein n=1 Tax=Desulfomonile tiedjei TaxID=2358 RepID=A0A9D6V0D3_9BACT|nr:ATP-binding cassette domain-containing protein [Desulfomonile tiedjei]